MLILSHWGSLCQSFYASSYQLGPFCLCIKSFSHMETPDSHVSLNPVCRHFNGIFTSLHTKCQVNPCFSRCLLCSLRLRFFTFTFFLLCVYDWGGIALLGRSLALWLVHSFYVHVISGDRTRIPRLKSLPAEPPQRSLCHSFEWVKYLLFH